MQSTIHHPTDSGVLGDGVRVLTRLIQRAKPLVAEQLGGVRDAFQSRVGTMRRTLQRLHRMRRLQGEDAAEQQRSLYQRLLAVTRQRLGQAQRVRDSLRQGEAHLKAQFDRFLPLVQHALEQARRRVIDGQPVASREKVLSLFEPHTRVVKRGKLSAAVEFGRQVVLDAVEGGIVTRFHVLADEESECHQAVPAAQHHQAVFGRPPWLVTGDRRLHTKGGEQRMYDLGVMHVVIPRMGRLTAIQRAREQQRSWRRRYRWRAGIEGRIHSLRRDYGLLRVRAHGLDGLEREVGWGVFASDLRHLVAGTGRRAQAITQRAA